MSKILIIGTDCASELQNGFSSIGESAVVWNNKLEPPVPFEYFIVEVDTIVVVENTDLTYIPDLSKLNCKKVFWSRNGNIESEFAKQKEFIEKNGVTTILNASHVSIDKFKSETIKSVWFPLCVDISQYPTASAPKKYPIVFCGDGKLHSDILTFVDINFPMTVFPKSETRQHFFDSVSPAYINFICCPEDIIISDVFETVASGAIVCMNRVTGIESLFVENREIIVYDTADDLKVKLYYFLHNQEPTNEMAFAAKVRLLNSHTYTHRANQLLHIIEK